MMTMQHREGERESGGRVGEGAYHHCCRCATPRAPTTPGSALPPGRVPSPLLQHWCLPPRVHTPHTSGASGMVHMWCSYFCLTPAPLCSLSAPLLPELRELRGIFRRSNKEKSVRAGGADAASGTVLGLARCLPHAPPVLACGMPWCWACAGLVLVVLVVPAHIAPLSGLQIEPTYQTPELKLFGAQLNQYNDATRFPTMKSDPIACPGYKADSGCCHGRHR